MNRNLVVDEATYCGQGNWAHKNAKLMAGGKKMTQNHSENIRQLNTSIDGLLLHIEAADTGFHVVPESAVERDSGERYERSFQVELDETKTRIEVTGLLSEQQSEYVATIYLSDEGELTNPRTELSATMPDGLLNELSGSIHEKLEAKQRRQSTIPPDTRKET